jgi:hypothetical protein
MVGRFFYSEDTERISAEQEFSYFNAFGAIESLPVF